MELYKLTLQEALDGLKSKKFTCVELTKSCLDRISELEPKVQAFVTVTPEIALEQATQADKLISEKGAQAFVEMPLLGVPYACKDNFLTEGIQTTASSKVLEGYIAQYESTVTSRLKSAGAVLLGKTNMDAWAHGSSTETSDFHLTFNPWDLSRVPGGSSGGSAAALAADMCIFAIGSETAGSIRCPAAWCGVSGFKPTYGRVSRYGVVAMASSTDSPGPITKTIADSEYVLKIIAGKDPHDATSSDKPVEFGKELQNLKGIKIGKPKSYFGIELEEGTRQAVESSIKKLEELGAEIVEMDLLDPKYAIAVYTIIQRSEVSSNLARFDGIRYGNTRDNFGFEARKRMMLGAYTLSSGYYDAYYSKAQKVRTLIIQDFEKAFETVDMIVAPTMPCVALKIGESAKSSMFGELMDVLTEASSVAGLPAISMPVGIDNGMPVGMQLMSAQFNEAKLSQVGQLFQASTDFHKKRPTL